MQPISMLAKTTVPIDRLLAKRWSSRALDPDRLVSEEQIQALCEAARWAPSCYNEQPWRFIILNRATDQASWEKGLHCLVELNQTWAKQAPVLFLVMASNIFHRNSKPNAWAQYDTGAAVENLLLEATSLGLMGHAMAGFDREKVQQEFAIPSTFFPIIVVAVGYELVNAATTAQATARERRPLGENFFRNNWQNPY